VLDLIVGGMVGAVKQCLRLHDEAGRAKPALRGAVGDEGLLERV
jgi:hypothetical protein